MFICGNTFVKPHIIKGNWRILSLNFLLLYFLLHVFGCFVCMSVHQMCAVSTGGQKRTPNHLGLELQLAVNCPEVLKTEPESSGWPRPPDDLISPKCRYIFPFPKTSFLLSILLHATELLNLTAISEALILFPPCENDH